MVKKIEVVIKGFKYPSISKACKELNVSKSKVYEVAKKYNMTCLETLEYYANHSDFPSDEKGYKAFGLNFPSIQALCDHFGLKPSTANDLRKYNNFTWEQTIQYYEAKKNGELPNRWEVDIAGRTFKNVETACEYFGYSFDAVKNVAYYEYIPLAEALILYISGSYPTFPNRSYVGAIKYPTHKHAFEPFNINNDWSYKLISEHGYTAEEVVRQRLPRVLKKLWHDEIQQFAEKGIDFEDLQEQVFMTGVNPQKLLSFYLKHKRFPDVTEKPFYIQYHTFPSIEVACLHFDLDIKRVMQLRNTYSWNGAFAKLLK